MKEIYLSGGKIQTNQLQYLIHNKEGKPIGFQVVVEGTLEECVMKLNKDAKENDGVCEHQIVTVIASAIL